ncbi:hypothetical protein ACN0PX_003489 [Escherichia coli]
MLVMDITEWQQPLNYIKKQGIKITLSICQSMENGTQEDPEIHVQCRLEVGGEILRTYISDFYDEKNDIYSEMLWRSLSYIRGMQTCSFISKGMDKTCYMEAELLHDVSKYLSDENMTAGDVKFLNYNARFIWKMRPHTIIQIMNHIKKHIITF